MRRIPRRHSATWSSPNTGRLPFGTHACVYAGSRRRGGARRALSASFSAPAYTPATICKTVSAEGHPSGSLRCPRIRRHTSATWWSSNAIAASFRRRVYAGIHLRDGVRRSPSASFSAQGRSMRRGIESALPCVSTPWDGAGSGGDSTGRRRGSRDRRHLVSKKRGRRKGETQANTPGPTLPRRGVRACPAAPHPQQLAVRKEGGILILAREFAGISNFSLPRARLLSDPGSLLQQLLQWSGSHFSHG